MAGFAGGAVEQVIEEPEFVNDELGTVMNQGDPARLMSFAGFTADTAELPVLEMDRFQASLGLAAGDLVSGGRPRHATARRAAPGVPTATRQCPGCECGPGG